MKSTYINCTPHAITVDGIGTIQPSGDIARVSVTYVPTSCPAIRKQVYGDVQNLPAEQKDTYFIVSALVMSAAVAQGRTDVVAPDTNSAKRDDAGHIVSVPGFVTL